MNTKVKSLRFIVLITLLLKWHPSNALLTIGANQSIKYEEVENYLGKTIIYFDQEIVSCNKVSFEVDSMMKCRIIRFTVQSTFNIATVGWSTNRSLLCKLAYQDPTIPQVQLGPRLGMFTFLNWDYGDFYPAINGIFYKTIGEVKPADAQNGCPGHWAVAYAITQDQLDILRNYMKANNLNIVQLNAQCHPTLLSANPTWNNSSAPFIKPVIDLSFGAGTYVNYNIVSNLFYCVTSADFAHYLVCMLNMHALPWEEI